MHTCNCTVVVTDVPPLKRRGSTLISDSPKQQKISSLWGAVADAGLLNKDGKVDLRALGSNEIIKVLELLSEEASLGDPLMNLPALTTNLMLQLPISSPPPIPSQ